MMNQNILDFLIILMIILFYLLKLLVNCVMFAQNFWNQKQNQEDIIFLMKKVEDFLIL